MAQMQFKYHFSSREVPAVRPGICGLRIRPVARLGQFPWPGRPQVDRSFFLAGLLAGVVFLAVTPAEAIPYFARKYNQRCSACHALPPLLNETGMSFVANGYRLREPAGASRTWPFALWITERVEAAEENGRAKGFPSRVEVISSDALTSWLSYFVEWRVVSYSTTATQRLSHRNGRFEDAFLLIKTPRAFSLAVGQFRMLNQWDVSRRLSLSEPLAFSAGVGGPPSRRGRLQSLRTFSLAGRAPALRATWRPWASESPADGWFHEFTLPFAGEFSIPLGAEADRNASLEWEARPKGFLYETYYRRGLSSLGGAWFVGNERWLANATGTLSLGNHHFLASVGTAKFRQGLHDFRLSVGNTWIPRRWFAVGARWDHQSARRLRPAFLPHLNFSFPGTQFTFLLTLEQRIQKNHLGTVLEVSAVF